MTGSTQDAKPRVLPTPLVVLLGAVALCGVNASMESFHPAAASAKLGLALLQLAAIGHAGIRLLGLRLPRVLAGAWGVMFGQLFAMAYVYARSVVSEATGLPGITIAEVAIAELTLGFLYLRRFPDAGAWPPRIDQRRLVSLGIHGLWLLGLLWIAIQKLGLRYTPSSDPDIHAFYTKILLARGTLFYDLQPISDAWMIYPSGFSALSLSVGRLSGLHPIQLVNIGAYLQLALFMGLAFSLLARGLRRPFTLTVLAIFAFGLWTTVFNPLFVEGRGYLEGTPRLAHTALLFFPLFFAIEYGLPASRRPLLSLIPLASIFFGLCINPTHAPAALLVGALAHLLFVSRARTRRNQKRAGALALAMLVLAGLVLAATVMFADPFYRSLARQQLGWGSDEVEAAEDLTGQAMRMDVDPRAIMGEVAREVPARLVPDREASRSTHVLEGAALWALPLCLFAWPWRARASFARRRASIRGPLAFGIAGMCFLILHAQWCIVAARLVRPDVLQSVLLIRYSEALQTQASLLILGFLAAMPVALALTHLELASRGEARSGMVVSVIVALTWIGLATPGMVSQARVIANDYQPKFRESPLGVVAAADVAFMREIAAQIPVGERVLLPGRLRRTPIEHWIFSTGPGRALPLHTDVRTAFFLGLDGRAFTADSYQAHVGQRFEPQWLRSQQVLWLLESGNFPPALLRRDYELVAGTDSINLWRLVTQ